MKKGISIAVLVILIIISLIPVNSYALYLSECNYEDLEETLKIEGITNYDLSKYNKNVENRVNIFVFRMNGCGNCYNFYKYYICDKLLAKYGDKINVISFETRENYNNYDLLNIVRYKLREPGNTIYTPYVVIGNKSFSGDLVVENAEAKQKAIEEAIMEQWNSNNRYDIIKELSGVTIKFDRIPFTDVKDSDWYYDSVKYVYNNKMVYGATDTLFKPNEKLTRGQLATIIWRMEKSPKVSTGGFSDVKADQYYYEAIKWAYSKKIVNGYDKEKFGPNDYITREQLAVILNNYAKYKGKNVNQTVNISTYKDASGVGSYAKEAVKWAIASKIINGKSNGTRIDPKGTATRGECATMLMNYCAKF